MAKKPSKPKSTNKKRPVQGQSENALKFLEEWKDFMPNILKERESPFDWDKVGRMLICGSNAVDVAATYGRTADAMFVAFKHQTGIRFSVFYNHCRAMRLNLLRASQTRNALQGDTSMLKFLGKNELGQRDKVDVAISGDPFTSFVKDTSSREQSQPETLPDWEDAYLDD